jgi:DNA-binding NarL/FixJ family response regulator
MSDFSEKGDPISPREKEVLVLLAEGNVINKVGEELSISRHTVKNHVKSIGLKLGTHNITSSVYVACKEHIIE